MTTTVVTPRQLLDALPNTLGSKKNQARSIFSKIAEAGYGPGKGHVLADPFFGGGSIAVLGKLLGYRVIAGDTSPRAEAVGQALLVNDTVQLEPADVAIAVTGDPEGWYIPSVRLLPWPENSRRLLAALCRAADRQEDPAKRALLRAFMVKVASHIAIYGQPRMTAHQRIREEKWDSLTPGQIARMVEPQTRPKEMARRVANKMYGAVAANGYVNEYRRGDVLGLVGSTTPDVLYLDPPWPAAEGYGRNYHAIDELLEGREIGFDESRFSQPLGWKHLRDVIQAAAHVPLVVLSLGGLSEHVSADELVELMRAEGRVVKVESFEYGLLRSRRTEKSDRKKEFVVIAARAGE